MDSVAALSALDVVVRVVAAAGLGGLVGLEREFSDQPAGFRTHILVSLGAALFTLVGAYGVQGMFGGDIPLRFDPTRVAAQVVTGIGFLGAGAIIREGWNVRGLTTAAALWVTAAIGTAAGLGYWTGAVSTTLLTVIALYGLKRLEGVLVPRLKRGYTRFSIQVGPELRLSDLAETSEAQAVRVESMKILDEGDARTVAVFVNLPPGLDPESFADEISRVAGVVAVDWRS